MADYKCEMGHNDWQLYDMKGVKAVAADLSGTLTGLVLKAKERLKADSCLSERKLAGKIRDEMYTHMSRVSDFGARDSEPEGALVGELEEAFGLETYSLER